jgi:hypothetical protein
MPQHADDHSDPFTDCTLLRKPRSFDCLIATFIAVASIAKLNEIRECALVRSLDQGSPSMTMDSP